MTLPSQQDDSQARQRLHDLLDWCVESRASDLHFAAGEAPYARVHGTLEPLAQPPLSPEEIDRLAGVMMSAEQRRVFEQELSLDVAYAREGRERFRINIYRERGQTAMAIRRLDNTFRTLKELSLPPVMGEFAQLRDGLVLVTGPTGSGKTTTLATLLHQINLDRACHIVTIEDPIEYIHHNEKSLVHQRELYADVPTFAQAVRASLREDPDVILVGEMRDTETIQAALTAAETGHLVFSTLHTGDTVGAVDRVIGMFPGDEQDSVRHQMSMVLRAVVAQRLMPTADGQGRVPAIEILRITSAVAHLIRSGKPQQIYSSIEAGTEFGMQTFEQSLADLVFQGRVDDETARLLARDERMFAERLRRLRAMRGAGSAVR